MAATIHHSTQNYAPHHHYPQAPQQQQNSQNQSQGHSHPVVMINHSFGIAMRKSMIPTDPLEESIYNLVLRGNGQDELNRPPPLYKSKFAQQVRAEHHASRRKYSHNSNSSATSIPQPSSTSNGGNSYGGGLAGFSKERHLGGSKVNNPQRGSRISGAKTNKSVKPKTSKPSPSKTVSKPLTKPTSGRIAMAAERRSNASTPVVADPSSWDNVAADEAEREMLRLQLNDPKAPIPDSHGQQYFEDEVPEELVIPPSAEEEAEYNRREQAPPTMMSSSRSFNALSTYSGSSGVLPGQRKAVGHTTKGNNGPLGSKFREKSSSVVVPPSFNESIQPPPAETIHHRNHHPSRSQSMGHSNGGARRLLPEGERLVILAGLRSNHASLINLYNRLPMITDTASKINRKISIENQLKLLEDDIKKFSSPNIIVEGN